MTKTALVLCFLFCLSFGGCWWKKDFSRIPDNKILDVGQTTDENLSERKERRMAVGEAEKWILEPPETETEHLSVHTLIVDLGKEMPPAYFSGRDAVVLVRRGSGIVAVGDQRYFVESGATVLVPKGMAVEIKQHGDGGPFVGIVVISPPMGDVGQLKPGPRPKKKKPVTQDSD